jgi:hypothetical protein
VHGDLVGQRSEVVEQVQGGRQQWGVVAVRPGQDSAQRDAVALDQHGAFHALFAPVDRGRAGDFAAAGAFVMQPSTAMS